MEICCKDPCPPPPPPRPCALLLLLEDTVHPPTIFNFTFFFITSPFRELLTVRVRWDAGQI
jgi:hypothetical protein